MPVVHRRDKWKRHGRQPGALMNYHSYPAFQPAAEKKIDSNLGLQLIKQQPVVEQHRRYNS
jgi:hypothetical protein